MLGTPGNRSETAMLAAFEGAAAAEKTERYDTALDLYNQGIDLLWKAVNAEQRAAHKQKLTCELEHFISRAEAVKTKRDQQKRAQESSTPSTVLGNVMSYIRPTSASRASSVDSKRAPSASSSGRSTLGERTGPLNARAAPGGAVIRQSSASSSAYGTSSSMTSSSSSRARAASADAPRRGSNSNSSNTSSTSTATDKRYGDLEEIILREIQDSSPGVAFDDIAGLAEPKQILKEAVIMPHLRCAVTILDLLCVQHQWYKACLMG